MFRWIFAFLGFLPIGWCRPNSRNKYWRNRRGGVVVYLGDLTENIGDVVRLSVFRSPRDAWVIRDKYGNVTGTIAKPFRGGNRQDGDVD